MGDESNPGGSSGYCLTLNPDLGKFSTGVDKWGSIGIRLSGQQVTVDVPARDAAVILLR